jgi:hypothetical protein
VTVTPKLTIKSKTKKAQANHKVTITSTITPGSGASKITLLQCNASKGAWSRIANAKPNKKGVVTYHWKLPVGKNYFKTRVIDHNGASGYQRPTSGKITIQGLGTVHAAVPPRAKHVKAC